MSEPTDILGTDQELEYAYPMEDEESDNYGGNLQDIQDDFARMGLTWPGHNEPGPYSAAEDAWDGVFGIGDWRQTRSYSRVIDRRSMITRSEMHDYRRVKGVEDHIDIYNLRGEEADDVRTLSRLKGAEDRALKSVYNYTIGKRGTFAGKGSKAKKARRRRNRKCKACGVPFRFHLGPIFIDGDD